jgi:hypothetical protein
MDSAEIACYDLANIWFSKFKEERLVCLLFNLVFIL